MQQRAEEVLLVGNEYSDDPKVWFEVRALKSCVVVTVGGEVDYQTAVGLGRAVEAAAAISSRLIIDLSQVSFIDSTGLGVLIGARSTAQKLGGSVSIVRPPDIVRRLLTSTSLQQYFPVYDSVDEALSAG